MFSNSLEMKLSNSHHKFNTIELYMNQRIYTKVSVNQICKLASRCEGSLKIMGGVRLNYQDFAKIIQSSCHVSVLQLKNIELQGEIDKFKLNRNKRYKFKTLILTKVSTNTSNMIYILKTLNDLPESELEILLANPLIYQYIRRRKLNNRFKFAISLEGASIASANLNKIRRLREKVITKF